MAAQEPSMRFLVSKQAKILGGAVFAIVVVVGLAAANGALHLRKPAEADAVPEHAESSAATIKLVENPPHTLLVPEDVRMALGIRKDNADRIAVAKPPKRTRALTMPGSTLLDPTRIYRIRARFAPSPSSAEVIQIGQIADASKPSSKSPTVFRELRSGDHVIKGNLLAVFYSVDVGNKKNDLIDAIYQLKLDEEILKRAESKAESVPEVFLLNARRNVQGDRNAIERAVSTLKTWGISDEDIQVVRDEAENVKKRDGKRDKSKDAQWARVEIKAPADGVIIERNLSMHEIVVDNTTNLFQIADVSRLFVTANVPEDDLPTLEGLSENQKTWTVQTVGSRPMTGSIDDIGYIIDPNQHTAVVKGYINNVGGKLRAGQFVSAAVELPPPPDVVEIPIDAVADDGQQSVVFVQSDPHKQEYTMRRVELVQRFDTTAFVRSKPFTKDEELTPADLEFGLLPKQPLRPDERVLMSGVGELKAVVLEKESTAKKAPAS
jgi:cobalt-zinc-cadmium efflux system membrane fusion protein